MATGLACDSSPILSDVGSRKAVSRQTTALISYTIGAWKSPQRQD